MRVLTRLSIAAAILIILCCALSVIRSGYREGDWRVRKTVLLIKIIEEGCKLYKRDHGEFPLAGKNFESGPCVYALSRSAPKGKAYIEFREDQVVSWPITESTHARNPEGMILYYRPNKDVVDLWCEDLEGNPQGFNNWEHRR